ncbi:MAG: lysophospholipid acyltransferase family protein [Muribaculaceae bacterium]|nr:lysophospholipid acyltransferase family protein [Muribaculaceae bacterium]
MKKIDSFKYHLLKGILKLLAHLPLSLLYPISSFTAWVLRDMVKYRRKVVEDNLRRVFPDASDEKIKLWTKQFYRHLCDIFIESVKLLGISDKEVDRRVKVYNAEIVDKAISEGQSVVLFLGHYGNWEWVPAIVRHFHNDAEMVQIYHPLHDDAFDLLMLKIRSRFGSESIPMAKTFRRLSEIKGEGKSFVAGFISDQRPQGHHTDFWTEFMGIETDYITGGEIIGNRLKCRYIYLDVEPAGRGRYNMTFKDIEPIDDGNEFPFTRSYLRLLENTIRRNPPYWLWSHKRFSHRHKKEE